MKSRLARTLHRKVLVTVRCDCGHIEKTGWTVTVALGGHGVPELLYPRPFGFHFLFFRSDVFLLLRSIAIRSCSASLDHSS
jgi:hypothetical protein